MTKRTNPDPVIYLAAPYTHKTNWKRGARAYETARLQRKMTEHDALVYNSVWIGHKMSVDTAIGDDRYWRVFGVTMLERCDALLILELDGWEESAGIAEEIKFAQAHDIPIYHIGKDYSDHDVWRTTAQINDDFFV